MKKFLLIAVVAGMAVIFFSLTGRITIPENQIGVRLGPGDRIAVFTSGQRPLVLPLMHRMIPLTSKPVRFVMAAQGALTLPPAAGVARKIDCQVRYQVTDGARLVRRFGTDEPQTALEQLLRQQISEQLTSRLDRDAGALDAVASRIPLIAETHLALNSSLQDSGVSVLSFELLTW